MGWVYELYSSWKSDSQFNEGRSILFHNSLIGKHFDYLKPGIEDPGYTRADAHDDMITKIIKIKESKIADGEKALRTSKFITVG